MRVLHFAVVLAGLVTLVSPFAQAQASDTLSPAHRAGLALARLGARQRVQIVTKDSEFVEGSVVTASTNLITLRTDGSVTDIAASNIDSLWVKHGTHAGTGALIGAGAGVLSFGIVLATCAGPAGEARDQCYFGGVIVSSLLLVGGTAVGALIGSGTPKWQVRVP